MTDLNATLDGADIVSDEDADQARRDPAGEPWMADAESPHLAREEGLRTALRSDLRRSRDWARNRAGLARTGIVESPAMATAWALGLGVLIGLLLRR